MMEEVREFCASALNLAETVIQSIATDFFSSCRERQEELVDISCQVLQYIVLVEEVVGVVSQDFHTCMRNLTNQNGGLFGTK